MRSPGRICHVCGKITPAGAALCAMHAAEAAARHASHRREHDPNQKVYGSAKWRNTRKRIIAMFQGRCALDAAPEPCAGTMTVHHVDHDVTNMVDANLVPLCHHHHGRIEAEHRRGKHDVHHSILDSVLEAIHGRY